MQSANVVPLDALRQACETSKPFDELVKRSNRGPDAGQLRRKPKTNYLLKPDYRQTSLLELLQLSDEAALAKFMKLRWGHLGENVQVCPTCGTIENHYWCPTPKRWKCRNKICGTQFTVLQGTRLHGTKKSLQEILGLMFEFVEGKDSISARQFGGKYDLAYHTAYVLAMKVRETLSDTMKAEPKLIGYIQADAAYFMKYVRPGNIGTGPSFASKRDQKNAGLNEDGKTKQTISPKMQALVVFVQTGPSGSRRYKVAVVKTENQVDLLTLGKSFCAPDAVLTTDGHSGYNFFSGAFVRHDVVDHSSRFASEDGTNTNMAENFFSRMRSAEKGAWHKVTIGHLEEYGWEFAWRQTMVGKSNLAQLDDLLGRLLKSGRSTRYADYWGKTATPSPRVINEGDDALAQEVKRGEVPKKQGRPSADSVRPQPPERPKRRYVRAVATPGQPPPAQANSP